MHDRIRVPLEIKSLTPGEFEGYGAVFKNVDFGGDVILPGAFKKSLASQEKLPPMFWMHKADQVPGKWLSMSEDRHGLKVKGMLADTQLGREVHTLLKMDAVSGMSIGYMLTKPPEFTDDGVRIIKEVDLIETSIVSLPMNPLAQISAVKARLSDAGEYVPDVREMEKHFRDIGCSKQTARRMIAKLYEGSGEMLDPDPDDAGGKLAESKEPSRCDAEKEPDEAELLEKLNDLLTAHALKRRMARR